MNALDANSATPGPQDAERACALFLEQTRSAEDAAKYGLLYARLEIIPKKIKTHCGEVEISEAWFERRPHPEVLKQAREKGDKKREHFTTDHILLCLLHRPLTVEEATMGGVWFTLDEEWAGFSMSDFEVRRFRFWNDEPTELVLTIAHPHDLEIEGTKVKPISGRGIMQNFRLKKKEPNQPPEPTRASGPSGSS